MPNSRWRRVLCVVLVWVGEKVIAYFAKKCHNNNVSAIGPVGAAGKPTFHHSVSGGFGHVQNRPHAGNAQHPHVAAKASRPQYGTEESSPQSTASEPQSPLAAAYPKSDVKTPLAESEGADGLNDLVLGPGLPFVLCLHLIVEALSALTTNERDGKDDRSTEIQIGLVSRLGELMEALAHDAVEGVEHGEKIDDGIANVLDDYSIWNVSAKDRELVEYVLDAILDAIEGDDEAGRRAETALRQLESALAAAVARFHAAQEKLIAGAGTKEVKSVTTAAIRVCLLACVLAMLGLRDGPTLLSEAYQGGMAAAAGDPATDARAKRKETQIRSNCELIRRLLAQQRARRSSLSGRTRSSRSRNRTNETQAPRPPAARSRITFANACKILGLTAADARDRSKVRAAHKRMAYRWHPDKNPGQDTSAKFAEIQNAYEAIINASNQ